MTVHAHKFAYIMEQIRDDKYLIGKIIAELPLNDVKLVLPYLRKYEGDMSWFIRYTDEFGAIEKPDNVTWEHMYINRVAALTVREFELTLYFEPEVYTSPPYCIIKARNKCYLLNMNDAQPNPAILNIGNPTTRVIVKSLGELLYIITVGYYNSLFILRNMKIVNHVILPNAPEIQMVIYNKRMILIDDATFANAPDAHKGMGSIVQHKTFVNMHIMIYHEYLLIGNWGSLDVYDDTFTLITSFNVIDMIEAVINEKLVLNDPPIFSFCEPYYILVTTQTGAPFVFKIHKHNMSLEYITILALHKGYAFITTYKNSILLLSIDEGKLYRYIVGGDIKNAVKSITTDINIDDSAKKLIKEIGDVYMDDHHYISYQDHGIHI